MNLEDKENIKILIDEIKKLKQELEYKKDLPTFIFEKDKNEIIQKIKEKEKIIAYIAIKDIISIENENVNNIPIENIYKYSIVNNFSDDIYQEILKSSYNAKKLKENLVNNEFSYSSEIISLFFCGKNANSELNKLSDLISIDELLDFNNFNIIEIN